MKKLVVSCLALLGFVLPSIAQVSHDYNPNDREPSGTVVIPLDQVPTAILKAFDTEFNQNDPQTWSKFPYTLKEYGWVYDVGASSVKPDRYMVRVKTNNGEMWAAYNTKGDLIETREMSANIPIPASIMDAFKNSQYTDWRITGNKEIIRYYHDNNSKSVEQHFRITVEKDGVKRSISFNYQVMN